MKNITVIKIGGSTFGSRDTTIEDIVSLQKQGESLVVVHGGGSTVTEWLKRQGVSTQFVHGERVTDELTLEVVTAVLAGLVNKEIVAAINSMGGWAVGISGVDGTIVEGKMKSQEMGYVGTVEKVNPLLLEALLKAGFIPVVSPVSLHSIERPDKAPQIINLNSDPVAGDIAAAVGAERLIFLTNVAGISDESGRIIPRLSAGEAEALMVSGVISGGMIPKINACLRALVVGSVARIIDGRQPHVLVKEMKGQEGGTTIYK
jgi:acetylglutamate kinase